MKAGGVRHLCGKPRLVKEIDKAVRGDFHDALCGRRKPDISLIVRGQHFNAAVDGKIVEQAEYAGFIEITDCAGGGDPDAAALLADPVDIGKGRRGDPLHGFRFFAELSVEDIAFIGAEVYHAAVCAVSHEGGNLFHPEFRAFKAGKHSAVFHSKHASAFGIAEDRAACAAVELEDSFAVQPFIVDIAEPHPDIGIADACGGSNIDIAAAVLRK